MASTTSIIPFPAAPAPQPPAAVIQAGNGQVFSFTDEAAARQFETAAQEAGGETLRLVPAEVRKTLFEIESDLEALQETVELVAPEQQEGFLAEFTEALTAAKEKRDRIHWFLTMLDVSVQADESEIERIRKRIARKQGVRQRLESYVIRVIQSFGRDNKGKWKPLEGNSVTLKLSKNPPTVAVADEAAVPSAYKTVTITAPALLFEEVCDALDMELRGKFLDAVKRPNSTVVKPLVKQAIAEHVPEWKKALEDQPAVFCAEVPGASIAAGTLKLVRE